MLLRALPADALYRIEMEAAEEAAKKPKADLIRERQKAFKARNQRARGVSNG